MDLRDIIQDIIRILGEYKSMPKEPSLTPTMHDPPDELYKLSAVYRSTLSSN